jgi:CO dehydrogenase maturation factor
VSDPSIRGIVTAARIANLTKALKVEVRNKVLVVNRVQKDLPAALKNQIQEVVQKTDLLFGGCVPASDDIFQSELQQESLLKLSAKTDVVKVITRIFDKFL